MIVSGNNDSLSNNDAWPNIEFILITRNFDRSPESNDSWGSIFQDTDNFLINTSA
jgi:hypothetical protein